MGRISLSAIRIENHQEIVPGVIQVKTGRKMKISTIEENAR